MLLSFFLFFACFFLFLFVVLCCTSISNRMGWWFWFVLIILVIAAKVAIAINSYSSVQPVFFFPLAMLGITWDTVFFSLSCYIIVWW